MQKINWKLGACGYYLAVVGGLSLYCRKSWKSGKKVLWYGEVHIRDGCQNSRHGLDRTSVVRAKKDAVKLARELLLDYYAGLLVEMKNFDLQMED